MEVDCAVLKIPLKGHYSKMDFIFGPPWVFSRIKLNKTISR